MTVVRSPRLPAPFVHFPDGLPGLGLLILRGAVTVGALEMALGLSIDGLSWARALPTVPIVIAAIGVLCGAWTRAAVVAVLAAIVMVAAAGDWSSLQASRASSALAVLLIGPGAYSLDARRHGRREIVVPR